MAKRKRRGRMKIVPQPPIDRWGHPTGGRSLLLGSVVAAVAVALLWFGPGNQHEGFDPGGGERAEWQLVADATLGRLHRVEVREAPAEPVAPQQAVAEPDAEAAEPGASAAAAAVTEPADEDAAEESSGQAVAREGGGGAESTKAAADTGAAEEPASTSEGDEFCVT